MEIKKVIEDRGHTLLKGGVQSISYIYILGHFDLDS